MNNVQSGHNVETQSDECMSLEGQGLRLSLPQVPPALVIATRQHSHASITPEVYNQPVCRATPFLQTPVTPPLSGPLSVQASVLQTKKDAPSVPLLSVPQLPFPTPRFDFSHSLRSGVTYIPRSMSRDKGPNVVDALIAGATLVLIGLFLLMLLCYFSM